MKFGIFEASGEYCSRKVPESSWDIVNADENIGKPLEVFETLEQAVKALYSNDNYKPTTECVYFIGNIEYVDEDEDPSDLDNMIYGDGYAVYGLYRDEYEEGYKPESPKITAVKFVVNGDAECFYKGVKVEFPEQGNMYDGDVYYIDGATVGEIEDLCRFAGNEMNYHSVEGQHDLIEDGVLGNRVTEIENEWKALRKSYGLTQAKMSEITGIPARTLQEWEGDRRTPPEYMIELVKTKLNEYKG